MHRPFSHPFNFDRTWNFLLNIKLSSIAKKKRINLFLTFSISIKKKIRNSSNNSMHWKRYSKKKGKNRTNRRIQSKRETGQERNRSLLPDFCRLSPRFGYGKNPRVTSPPSPSKNANLREHQARTTCVTQIRGSSAHRDL